MTSEPATHQAPSAPEIKPMPLRSLGLRPGMALQTRRLVEGSSKKESQFFAAIEGRGVMVGPLGSEGAQTGLEAGDVCVVQGFTGQYEFSFSGKVLQTFDKPFVYALLAYPAQVDARIVRQSMRTKATCPTTVRRSGGPGEAQDLDVTLIDVSMAGCMIKSTEQLGAVGDLVTVSLTVQFDATPVCLALTGSICHNNKARDETAFFMGLAFKNLNQHDKLVLHYLTQSGADV